MAPNDAQSTGTPVPAVDPAATSETEKPANVLHEQPAMYAVQPASEAKEASNTSASKSETDIEIASRGFARPKAVS
jgi:hypothetical protein